MRIKTRERVLTKAQTGLLASIKANNGSMHVIGPAVGVAKRLSKMGLVQLTDDGPMVGRRGNADGERWMVETFEVAS